MDKGQEARTVEPVLFDDESTGSASAFAKLLFERDDGISTFEDAAKIDGAAVKASRRRAETPPSSSDNESLRRLFKGKTAASSRAARQRDLTITALSDTHKLHRELKSLPGGDILVHAGDFSLFSQSFVAIKDFAEWFADQPYRHKLVTFGNHEFFFEADPLRRSIFEREGITVLVNEPVLLDGLRVWGSPVTPLYGAAFGLPSPRDRKRHWARMPQDTDLLVTHSPPLGFLDRVRGRPQHLGDPELGEAVRRVRPRVHIFGHIHGGFGIEEADGTSYVNAALLGTQGELEHQPMTIRLPRLRRGSGA